MKATRMKSLLLISTATILSVLMIPTAKAKEELAKPEAYTDPNVFANDISQNFVFNTEQANGLLQLYTGDCSGTESCGDYFDAELYLGDTLTVSFCDEPGGAADFDTGIGIWSHEDLVADPTGALPLIGNDDYCELSSQITFRPSSVQEVYRVLLGTFGNLFGGSYTVAVRQSWTGGSTLKGNFNMGNGTMLVLPKADATDIVLGSCSFDFEEGGMVFSPTENAIYICSPDNGGWQVISLTPKP